jgi:hypothetical protein
MPMPSLRVAQCVHDLGVQSRSDELLEKSRQDRALRVHRPRPHLVPCACDDCRRWAHDVFTSISPAGDGS